MLTFCALTLLPISLLGAEGLTVSFDGDEYAAAFRSEQPGVRLVEFVRDGETLENWTKLFAVRHFPRGQSPAEAVRQFEQVVREHNPLAGVLALVKDDGSEAMIDFLTWPPDHAYMELNVHRYLKQPGLPGLVSYQFAFRFRVTPDVTADKIREHKEHWCDLMRELELPAIFE